eukprot:4649779-Ditylum_brightwellii.AAC.2
MRKKKQRVLDGTNKRIHDIRINHKKDKQRALDQMGNRIDTMRETAEKQSHKSYKEKTMLRTTTAHE